MNSPLVPTMRPYSSTIFSTMSALANDVGAINLGQGFPDEEGPAYLVDAAVAALRDGQNQYAPGPGLPDLRRAVAEHQERWYGVRVDPDSEVLVTVGATEAIAAAILALVGPGDEVVTFAPYYDSYPAMVARAGGRLRTYALPFPDGDIDPAALAAVFSDRTRLVVLNTPHNPTGKVFTRQELQLVLDLAARNDAWIVTDEVYEHLVLGDARHVPMATLPGAAERTLTVSSAGKTFSMTGWKVGWVTGPAEGVAAVQAVKQFLTFTACGPFQHAVAVGLRRPEAEFATLAASLGRRRDLLADGLRAAGLRVNDPEGTYFLLADAAPLGMADAAADMPTLATRCGVVGVPVSAFHPPAERPGVASLVRFAFCKRDDVLTDAVRRLAAGRG